ncbi:GNAT family N-acetyltransferase [Ferruginibacter sp.]|uniref:GNAT family N-acetyltransferase n=1 Tax=Ferruginibacter sp. TaxID=1940288 RepID=UPI0019C58087|nr:GNAT family N-acetyltransferase [Ferruginibacter sp.]MBC7629732.1 GNAT family N-acetyltransferase [Ferruginibacter sp.]
MQLNWIYKSFHLLTVEELYAIMQLRNEVFSVEQNCVYQDADDKDQASYHLAGWDGKKLAAYCRILPAGLSYDSPSIGRVVSSPAYRNSGCGRRLMQLAIAKSLAQFNHPLITISAQFYLQKFYSDLGFKQISDIYQEDGIPHIKMQLRSGSK